MNEEAPPVSNNICRVCLAESGAFQSIFVAVEEAGLPLHLSEMIMSFTSLQVCPRSPPMVLVLMGLLLGDVWGWLTGANLY